MRVTAPAFVDRRLVGRLVAANDGSLTVALDNKTVVVPRQALTRLEVSRRPGRKARGAGIGFLVGAASGALLGYSEGRRGYALPVCSFLPPCDSFGHEYDYRANDAISYGLLLGALGAGFGAAVAPGERWEAVGTDRVRVHVSPARRGAGLMVALSF